LERLSAPGTGKFALFQFFRYNVVGKNTYPNMTPIVSGQRVPDANKNPVDRDLSELFYWHRPYRGRGYASMYAVNLCQDYFLHYWNTTVTHIDQSLDYAFCNPQYEPLDRSNFQGPYAVGRRCLNGRSIASLMLGYVGDFFDSYRGVGRVALAQMMEAHEGSMEVVGSLDPTLSAFLERMERASHLEDTVTVIGSDHGMHMSPYSSFTEAGKIERKLGTLMLLVPRSFLSRHPGLEDTLRENQQRLVSAYDIHMTLKHIPTYPHPPPPTDRPEDEPKWGISLFEKIPRGRTCDQAGIPEDWCTCK
jgi:hypothetical protein